MINIVLSGGSGTRLWPISRTLMPKQFVKLFDGESLFQKTLKRNANLSKMQFIVSNQDHFFLASDQIEEINFKNNVKYLLETMGRNTAPAITLTCFLLDDEDIVFVTPSDHLIRNIDNYEKAVREAKDFAEKGYIVTFGIKPDYPETGYGYIEADGNKVLRFREKPDLKTAKEYLEKSNFYWNSGMFCFKVKVLLEEIEKHDFEIYDRCKKAINEKILINDSAFKIKKELMLEIPENSIDYAVMEKTDKACVIPCDIGWTDMGSFDSLFKELPKDRNNNVCIDNKPIILDSKNNLFISDNKQIVSIDVNDLLVVDTPDALLVSKKGSAQKVKEAIKILKEQGSELPDVPVTVYRPWGSYTVLEEGKFYKIKKIVVKPGKRLSMQKHFHRNEHWIVVSGTALVTIGDEEKIVRANESIYIKMGYSHRLENPGKIDLVIIEVQVGEYVGEDDIIRIDDDYYRV